MRCMLHILETFGMILCQEWQLLEGTIQQLVSELFMKLKQEKSDTSMNT